MAELPIEIVERPLQFQHDAIVQAAPLLRPDALDALRHQAFPRATLVTPNLDEVRLLTGIDARTRGDLLDAAKAISDFGPRWVLIKSGHLAEIHVGMIPHASLGRAAR